ncbi:MAG: hypothetical protein ACOH5I_03150 [Oligoflexus sp.]
MLWAALVLFILATLIGMLGFSFSSLHSVILILVVVSLFLSALLLILGIISYVNPELIHKK